MQLDIVKYSIWV